jgi:hypothetical protein
MRSRKLVFVLCASVFSMGVRAQANEALPSPPAVSNTVFFELIGSAPVFSLNYERALWDSLMLRGGLGYLRATSFGGYSLDRVQVPLLAGYLLGAHAHRLEVGFGAVPGFILHPQGGRAVEVPAAVVVGYRYRPPAGGYNVRVGLTPIFDFWDASWRGLPVIPLLGLSLGYGF